ncbi:MAG: hypothetical protein GY855_17740, partial [candidate division Zixibacteria bacterium]|nr:hypothetical protein [candidate division Zixibacteria bacterium]
LPMVSAPSSHIGIYEVVSGWAILREVYGDDLDAYFDTPTVRNVDVFLTTNYECEPPSEEEHAIGTIKVAHYEYYIQGVCFFDDVNLERDSVISATEFEVVPIYMPQWKDDPTGQKNLPISYVRGTQLEIGAKICASHIPNHSMPFRFLGFGRSNGEYDSRFNIEPETGAYSTQVFYIWHLTQPDGVTVPGTIDSLDMGITWALHNSHSESIEEALLRTTYHELLVIDAQRPGVWGRANTLSLRKACHYANGLRGDNPNVGPIALKCMNETYDEASDTNDTWDYNPDLEPDTTYLGILRPYVPARYHKGQCADFANLLVTYMHDLGIAANSRYVWSGTHSPAAMYYNFWYWTESNPPNAKNVILSNELEVCDGEEKCWFFRYHQIMNISYPTVDISYDAVFNMSGPYDDWVRHYWEEDGVDFYDFPDFGTGRPTSSNYFHREYINHYWP